MKHRACTLSLISLLFSTTAAAQNFDAQWARLRSGREYSAARTGEITYQFPGFEGTTFETTIDVPAEYNPKVKWPVRVELHGGVARPFSTEPRRGRNALPGVMPQIVVHPRGWAEARWWQANQVENIERVLERLKREYNVDESRVYITGFSDGGTGAFFFGMRAPTRFSAIMPLHGNIAVLANPSARPDGQMYPANLANRPVFATNGGRDPLYPVSAMAPLIEMIRRSGVEILYRPLEDVGHDRSWWPSERERFERFVNEHPRVAHPARLTWETERTDRYNRVDWLVITSLGATASDQKLDDVAIGIFGRSRASGRVDVVRNGNTFDARSRGVKRFALLLSPDVVDFAKPVKVVVNGREAFAGTVAKDPRVLLKWAARDQDREVLYAAELEVEVK